MRSTVLIAAALTGPIGPAGAQSLVDRLTSTRDGEVRLEFTAREGICGDGRTFIQDREHGHYINYRGSGRWRDRFCEEGPVRVALRFAEGRIRSVKTYVGGDWTYQRRGSTDPTDLGAVSAPAAARAFLALARRPELGDEDDLVFPATLADSAVIWPELLTLAKDVRASRESRKKAVFWLSQAAGDKAAEGLAEIVDDDDEDREVREHAVFALSQLPRDEGVPILIRAARSNRDPNVRRKALFWLGQSEDPRAIALFEEILAGKR